MQVSFIRFAIFGINSEMLMPGTDVGIDRNGPPVGVPGLGSQVSSWLEPPASQSRITRFCCDLSAPAKAGCLRTSSTVMSAATAAAPAAIAPRNPRRPTPCSGEPQKVSVRLFDIEGSPFVTSIRINN